ncbi:ankyrin repeat-containing domain protein [Xylariales sp. AK1849]|nr:ankyrin repeat-containing domain protein [Xylariales sp. AK1849]
MTQFLELPVEILELIFEHLLHLRSFKRFMRLRFVSRRFCQHVTDVLFRSHLLDNLLIQRDFTLNLGLATRACKTWLPFVETYFVRRILAETDDQSRTGQLRLKAEHLQELMGASPANSLVDCIRALCRVAFWVNCRILVQSNLFRIDDQDPFKGFTLDAALVMNNISLATRLLVEESLAKPLQDRRFYLVAFYGSVETFRWLVANTERVGVLGGGLCRHAAVANNSEIFNIILDNVEPGWLLNQRTFRRVRQFDRAFRRTASVQDYERGAALMGPDNIVFDEQQNGGLVSRLWDSVRHDRLEMVRYFLDRGVCLNHPKARNDVPLNGYPRESRAQFRPLQGAIMNENEDMVKMLLRYGADPNWYPAEDTALSTAVRWRRLGIARVLLQSGADVNFGVPPPIVQAVLKEDTEMIKLLRANGAALDKEGVGAWAMTSARLHGLESMVSLLAQEGIDESVALQRVRACEERCAYY